MAFPAKKPKRDFLDDVVDEMGPGKNDGDAYGASMEEEPEEGDQGDEETQEDQVMAAKQVAKALGIQNIDAAKFAAALGAFVKAC
jgi:hypothetical protein